MWGTGERWGSQVALRLWLLACAACSDEAQRVLPQRDPQNDPQNSPESAEGPLDPPVSTSLEELYDPEHVLEVSIELDAADWAALRGEGRGLFDVFLGQSEGYEFTEFTAAATVDGQRYEGVAVRKKGFLGSLSRLRPSLKLDFGDELLGAPRGFKGLTLNNDRQDPSHARQCLAYGLFTKAGLPAPRCNLAHVSVNGEDLGTFSNIEAIKKPFLARHFGDDSGNLYEGQTVDFTANDIDRFQLKTNEAENDRSDLERLVSALDAPDAELVARSSEVLDLDQFRDFWALETLSGHWDGYTGDQNNYYIYADPESGRFKFIPWGTDGSFADKNPFDPLNTTRTVYAHSRIASRLYALPDERERFRQRLGELRANLWDEAALVSELDAWTERAGNASPEATLALKNHLQTHGGLLRAELAEPAPEWIELPDDPSPCGNTVSDLSIEFSTEYGDLAEVSPERGTFQAALTLDGAPFEGFWFGRAGFEAMPAGGMPAGGSAEPVVLLRALSFWAEGTGLLVQLSVPEAEFAPGSRALHGLESFGVVLALDGAETRLVGFVSRGTLELDAASPVLGARVSGRLNAGLLQLTCADL